MRTVCIVVAAGWCLTGAGCAGSGGASSAASTAAHHVAPVHHHRPPGHRRAQREAQTGAGHAVALVTAEGADEVLAVSVPHGRVIRRVRLAAPATTVAAGRFGPAVAVSPASGTVTILRPRTLRPAAVLRSFRSPQIAAVAPGGAWALVSDAAAGSVSAIDLATGRVADRVFVGYGAHHMAISPDGGAAWVALGETAHTIVTLDCSDMRRLRVTGRIHPAVAAHDLAFSPSGATVWVTSASVPYLTVYGAASRRPLARVGAGDPPQHVAFGGPGEPYAYIASGYGSSLEMVDPRSGRVVRRAILPYGSFNLGVAGDVVVTTSLLNGHVTELAAATLRRRAERVVAGEARAVAVAAW
jgi:DNA-binding beta-propeller fold protein YncE